MRVLLEKLHNEIELMWIEKVCCQNLALDSGIITRENLDKALEIAKRDPENLQQARENFAGVRKALAEFGLADSIEKLSKVPPTSNKLN